MSRVASRLTATIKQAQERGDSALRLLAAMQADQAASKGRSKRSKSKAPRRGGHRS